MKRGNNRGGLGKKLSCSGSERAAKLFWVIDDLDEPVVPAVQGQVVTVEIIRQRCKKVGLGFALFSAQLNPCSYASGLNAALQHCDVTWVWLLATIAYRMGGSMANVEKISIALPADMASLVRSAVETGDYASSSEVIREALREWKARRAARSDAISEIRRLWDEGIKSGPSKDLDIAAIKKRGRQRLQADRKR
jgi:antitoxin ParD1/3/4